LGRLSPDIEREAAILVAVGDVLSWTRTSEPGVERTRSVRWVIYPTEAERLKPVVSAGNPMVDGRPELWEAQNKIFDGLRFGDDDRQTSLILDDDWTSISFIREEELKMWKEEAQLVIFMGYELVLEDGPELPGSSIYAPGCSSIRAAVISEETMALLRES
jgi:hypothetical protein